MEKAGELLEILRGMCCQGCDGYCCPNFGGGYDYAVAMAKVFELFGEGENNG